jgi:hypothetical protein
MVKPKLMALMAVPPGLDSNSQLDLGLHGWYVFHALLTTTFLRFLVDPNYAILPSPPFDTISSIQYSPTDPDKLLVSSWDTVHTHISRIPAQSRLNLSSQCGSTTLATQMANRPSNSQNSSIAQQY